MFRVTNDHDTAAGTSLLGEFRASYAELRELLGEPTDSDGYKVSTQWIIDYEGKPVTVYDYKETSLYSDSLPTVDEFRARPSYDWHVGARDNRVAARFIADIKRELAIAAATRNKE